MQAGVTAPVGCLNPELVGNEGDDIVLGDKNSRHKTTVKYDVLIHDARQIKDTLTLDKNAVVMVPLVSKVQDYHNQRECKKILYPEVCAKALELTGGTYAWCYSHTVRSEDPEMEAKLALEAMGLELKPAVVKARAFSHAYARFAHTDAVNADWQWDWGRRQLRREMKLSEEQCSAETMDIVFLNFWKPYDRPVQANPLTVLDAASLEKKDVITANYTAATSARGGKGAPVLQVLSQESHRWLYWPNMTPDEALFFKQTDSRDTVAKNAFHTAFDDPTSAKDAPGRRSLECRIIIGIPKTTTPGQARSSAL